MPKGYEWAVKWAKRRNRKERAMEKMMIGIRKELIKGENRDGDGEVNSRNGKERKEKMEDRGGFM